MEDEFISASDVVALGGGFWKDRRAVWRSTEKANGLPAYKNGSKLLFRRAEVLAYIESCRKSGGVSAAPAPRRVTIVGGKVSRRCAALAVMCCAGLALQSCDRAWRAMTFDEVAAMNAHAAACQDIADEQAITAQMRAADDARDERRALGALAD